MDSRFSELRNKDVVNIKTGEMMGCVNDVVIDTCTANVTAVIIYGRCKFFGLFGREDDCIISWDEIEVFGKDILLVNCKEEHREKHKRRSIIDGILGTN